MNEFVRPSYETESDRTAEQAIAAEFAGKLGCVPHKLSRAYGLDYAMVNGRDVAAYAEIKNRPGLSFGFRDGYYIAAQKVIRANELAITSKRPCFLVVRFSCGRSAWVNFERRNEHLIIAGRLDRGDPCDQEPCCIFDWSTFRRV